MSKIFWFDIETTGLDPQKNDFWQIAFDVEIDGELVATHEFRVRPHDMNSIDPQALAIGRVTTEQLLEYPLPSTVFPQFLALLAQYVDQFKKGDVFIPAGYNVANFDVPFLRNFFKKMGSRYYGSWFSNYPLDVYHLTIAAHALVGEILPKYKLVDVCSHYGIPLSEAHDARYDNKATRQLCYLLRDLYFKGFNRKSSIEF